jgi:hypothetical protein
MNKKPAKVIDLAAKKYARQVLETFDKLGHQQRREQTEKRAEVERKARNTI